jgi:hypothetical protein
MLLHPLPDSRRSFLSMAAIAVAALIMLFSTIQQHYLFLDETWYIRAYVAWWDFSGWSVQGRPLLHFVMVATQRLEAVFGLGAIYIYRLLGVLLLAGTGALFARWLRLFGFLRLEATFYAIGLISLPAFQVLAATSVQLGVAILSVLLAVSAIYPVLIGNAPRGQSISRIAIAATLCLASLCIYQISFLLTFALLLLPMLQTPRRDVRRHVVLAAIYLGLALVVVVYYLAWRSIHIAPSGGENAQYSPHAATFAAFTDGLSQFRTGAMHHVANLWHVEDVSDSLFFYTSIIIVFMGAMRLLYVERMHGLCKLGIAVVTLLVCDIFRLAADHPPTYTTLHALSTAWWTLVVWSMHCLVHRPILQAGIAVFVALTGVTFATWTTTIYITAHNAGQFAAIEQGMRAAPSFAQVHIFGVAANYPQLYEYGWSSGASGSYTEVMAQAIAHRYFKQHPVIGVTHVAAPGNAAISRCVKPDLAIRLPSVDHRCSGQSCSLSDAEIARFDWATCKASW